MGTNDVDGQATGRLDHISVSIAQLAALLWIFLLAVVPACSASALASGTDLAAVFAREVDRRLDVPPDEQAAYARTLDSELAHAGLSSISAQYIVLVDRGPAVQAVFVVWRSPEASLHFIGASPVSTGKPGAYDHFLTPLGVFEHTLENMDFRARGTLNDNGIRGYGRRGMRVFDFGWVLGDRTWGTRGQSPMRLQMHATDPKRLEQRLGEVGSKGCIRIPASLDVFIDRYGLLDADYEQAMREGRHLWMVRPDRDPTPWPGRYLVIIDSRRKTRPAWSPQPSSIGSKSSKPIASVCGGSTTRHPR